MGDENIGRSTISVPEIVASYQMFMNGVDRMDQRRSTNPTQRREKRIYMSVWTYYLHLIVNRAFCLYDRLIHTNKIKESQQELDDDDENDQEECSDDHNILSDRKLSSSALTTVPALMDFSVGYQMQHVVTKNKFINGTNQIACFLCSMVHNDGKRRCSKYGYIICGKGSMSIVLLPITTGTP